MQKNEILRYAVIFILCLALVGGLVIGGYLVTDRIAVAGDIATKVANLGSHQRTLSARIIGGTMTYANSPYPTDRMKARGAVRAAIQEFKSVHKALTQGDATRGIPEPHSPEIDAINFGAPYFLDEKVRRFLFAAMEIIDRSWTPDLTRSPYFRDIRGTTAIEMAKGLEGLAGQYAQGHEEAVTELRASLAGITGVIVAVLIAIGAFVFIPLLRRLSRQTQELIELARTDPLTGCHNRRSFVALGAAELDRFRRYEGDLSVIMLDIDKFKLVNDTYGHAVGDEVIKALAETCLGKLRTSDILGRLGGEEFAILLPETPVGKGILAAEKIRINLSETQVEHPGGVLNFTASFGIAPAMVEDRDIMAVLNRADEYLYKAKETGRNKVVGPEGATPPTASGDR